MRFPSSDVACTRPGRIAGVPCGDASAVSPVLFLEPRLGPRWHRCRSLGRPADIGLRYLQSGQRLGCSLPLYPRSGSSVPASRGNPPPGAVCCSAPFCAAHSLIASAGPSSVRMHLDVAGVDHQPLKVRVIDDRIQKLFPYTSIPPATKAMVNNLGYSSSPRSPVAGLATACPVLDTGEPQSADSKTPRSETGGCTRPVALFSRAPQAKGVSRVPRPSQKCRDADVPLSYPHPTHSHF